MLDVLIIGAGPTGLCAAKTIIEAEGDHLKIRLLDRNKTLGGVWARENLYPGLTTNNLRGGIDFSDFPMDDSFGVSDGRPIPGEVVHEYMHAYGRKWNVLDRIQYSTTVEEVCRPEDGQSGWIVRVRTDNSTEHETIHTARLIVATGICHRPHHPRLPSTKAYDAPIIHSAALGTCSHDLLTSKSVESVTVLGGAKSAYDAAYLFASAGKKVHWVIRASGKGPVWVFPSHTQLGPVTAWRERLPVRRVFAAMSPWLWGEEGWWRSFLHNTWMGRKVSQAFWKDIHHVTLRDCKYNTEECLKVLEPEQSPFWYGTASGVYNYPPTPADLYTHIRTGRITIHRGDIISFTHHSIHLSTSTTIPSDALITATGFSPLPSLTFTPTTSHSSLGIPSTQLTTQQQHFWSTLSLTADLHIATKFPRLLKGPFRNPSSSTPLGVPDVQDSIADDRGTPSPSPTPSNPSSTTHTRNTSSTTNGHLSVPTTAASTHHTTHNNTQNETTPYRLFRNIAPPGLFHPSQAHHHQQRDLVFVGMMSNISNTVRMELQCLWAWAYLQDGLYGLAAEFAHQPSPTATSNFAAWPAENGRLGDDSDAEDTDPTWELQQRVEEDEARGQEAQKRIYEETALEARYWALRAPYGHGKAYPDAVFDQVGYWDMLVGDLGLEVRRKGRVGGRKAGWWGKVGGWGWGWWREMFWAYTAGDYEGVVGEWCALREKKRARV